MPGMHTRETILRAIDDFLARSGMTERQFSMAVAGDHKLVKRLREGKGITLTVIERAEAFILAWRPEREAPTAAPSEAAQ
jgi:hypothetical protein